MTGLCVESASLLPNTLMEVDVHLVESINILLMHYCLGTCYTCVLYIHVLYIYIYMYMYMHWYVHVLICIICIYKKCIVGGGKGYY